MGKVSRSRLSAGVMKALGIFGSLEALKILCSVARTKLVAIWIGAAGVGVISLYSATIDMIRSIALLNLRQSSVPAIASASDDERPHLVQSVDVLGLIIGVIATIIVTILSPLLSWLTFGSYDYSWGFALLAPTLLAYSVGDARQAILQGVGRLGVLAKASLYAVVASTVVAIPLFYFFRMAAIVPVLIVFPSFSALFLFVGPATKVKRTTLDRALFKSTVSSLIKLGSYLTVGISMGFAADYALRAYLSWNAGVETVGLFQSGYTIIKSYVGLFFTAITMEFFPRLSATISRRSYTSVIVAHEIGLALWVLMPVVVVFIASDHLIVRLLYSSSFLDIVPYVSIAVTATLLRAVSWCFSYVIVAKGDGKVYILTEGLSAVTLLGFSWLGWHFGGYAGLGWAYLGEYVVFTAATWAVCHFRYGLRMPAGIVWLAVFSSAVAAAALLLKVWLGWWAPLVLAVPLAFAAFKRIRS